MKYPDNPVLLVDDEELVLDSLEIVLNSIGISNIIRSSDPRQAESILKENSIEIVLLDILMPHLPGDELLKRIKQNCPEIPAIMISAVDELEKAVSCMRNGAFDYIVKPVNKERLTSSVQKALEARDLRREIGGLREKLLNGERKALARKS